MNDPGHAQVTIQQLCRTNEELIGYMNPTEQQARTIRENSIIIARLSLQIADFYKPKEK